jgi:hypothetical protein
MNNIQRSPILNAVCRIRDVFIPDPDFYPSRISDLATAPIEEEVGKPFFLPFFVGTNHKIVKDFIFKRQRKIVSQNTKEL